MTVANVTPVISYLENGSSTGPHAVPYQFIEAAHLVVERISAAAVVTTLLLGVDYSVAGGGVGIGGYQTGSLTMTAAGAAGVTLRISRHTPRVQGLDYTPNDTFPAESHEQGLDKLTLIVQEIDAGLEDAILGLPGLAEILTAFAGLTGTGYIVRRGHALYATRTIEGTEGEIDVLRGNAVDGNTVISIANPLILTGTDVVGGTFGDAPVGAQIFLINPGDHSWTNSENWGSAKVELIAAGGNGGLGTRNDPNNYAGGGGGGGQYAQLATLALTPGQTINYRIGAAGGARGTSGSPGLGDCWFSSAATAYAQAGAAGVKEVGGAGGSAAAVGSCTVYNGGAGTSAGTDAWNGAGGGGSGGPIGAGKAGGNSNGGAGACGGGGGGSNGGTSTVGHNWDESAATQGRGGEGTSGAGGGAKSANGTAGGGGGGGDQGVSGPAGAGGVQLLWNGAYGPSGGGGGAIYFGPVHQGGAGGAYGGGAGGNNWNLAPSGTPGVGGQGIIVLTRLS